MNWHGFIRRLKPLALKLSGQLPLCPWQAVFCPLNPFTLGGHPPPMRIDVVAEEGKFKRLRFDGKHESWFPIEVRVSPELWSEYLSVFWDHPSNAHCYRSHGTPIAPGDVVVDCGCCEGFFVFQALEAGAAKVIAVEPNANMVQCLEKTFAAEIRAGRVVIVPAALGAFRGQTSFSFDASYPAFGQMGGQPDGERVAVETVAAICERLGLARVDFVKMDIEGAEIQAVEGALPTLKRFHPKLAITTYHRGFDCAALQAMLQTAGYPKLKAVGVTYNADGGWRPVLLHGCGPRHGT
jgi:FkbM family methyltransferase